MWSTKRTDQKIAWNHKVKTVAYSSKTRTSKPRKNKKNLLGWPTHSQVLNAGYDFQLSDDKNLIKACLAPSINISRKKWTDVLNRHIKRN